jgi:hypothetical protein
MMIGGGNFGKYVVIATLDNEVFYSLEMSETAHKLIEGVQLED